MDNLDSSKLVLINDDYFSRVSAQYHMDNKNERRPHFFAVPDPENPDIVWVVPCSTDVRNKHKDRIAKTNPNSAVYNYTQFERVKGVEQVLLFEKALPVLKEDIKGNYTNRLGEEFILDNPQNIKKYQEVAKDIIPLLKNGKKFSRYQPDQKKMYQQLNRELREKVAIPETKFSINSLKQSQGKIDSDNKQKEHKTIDKKKTIL